MNIRVSPKLALFFENYLLFLQNKVLLHTPKLNHERKCVLSPDINKCPDYDGKGHCLGKTDGCGMLRLVGEKQVAKNEYVRKPRWFEKYYK